MASLSYSCLYMWMCTSISSPFLAKIFLVLYKQRRGGRAFKINRRKNKNKRVWMTQLVYSWKLNSNFFNFKSTIMFFLSKCHSPYNCMSSLYKIYKMGPYGPLTSAPFRAQEVEKPIFLSVVLKWRCYYSAFAVFFWKL